MHILVTGVAGCIGTNLCLRLLQLGHNVVGVDNFITGTKNNAVILSRNRRFTFIRHDITKSLAKKLIRYNFSDIYHLACPTGVANLTRLGEEMLLTSSVGTLNILNLAKEKRAKLLFTSSSEIYGDPKVSPQGENYTGNVDPVGMRSTYEEGKRFAESLIVFYARRFKLDAKIVRLFNVYGPYMNKKDSRVIPTFLRQAKDGIPLTVHGDGSQRRTFCYTSDLVEGLRIAMEKGTQGEVYNLGSDKQITMRALALKVIALTKSESRIQYVARPAHDHKTRLPSLEKIGCLGWKPKTSLDAGLADTMQWFGF